MIVGYLSATTEGGTDSIQVIAIDVPANALVFILGTWEADAEI